MPAAVAPASLLQVVSCLFYPSSESSVCKHCVLLMTQMKNRIFILMSMKLYQIYKSSMLMVFTF